MLALVVASHQTRLLADDELQLCRDIAWWISSRVAACWALAEATARGVELAKVIVDDVDLDAGSVWIAGTADRISILRGDGMGCDGATPSSG